MRSGRPTFLNDVGRPGVGVEPSKLFKSARTEIACAALLFPQALHLERDTGESSLLYVKNIPAWERAVRVVAGLSMTACGLFGLKGLAIGYLIAAAGTVTLLTGFVGFCPMCAMAGRHLGPRK
jgi:hypothetical protein